MQPLAISDITAFPLLSRGKVRDIYGVSNDTILIVTTDRMSAFDVVLGEAVPYKGAVLNGLTLFWMRRFSGLVRNHLVAHEPASFPEGLRAYASMLEGRSVLARKAVPLPVECIVRGHLAGGAWREYRERGTVGGAPMLPGLLESGALPAPLFMATTKAAPGEHDAPLSGDEAAKLLGEALYRRVENISLAIFAEAREYASKRGVIIADTKFEFGFVDGELCLIDEVLTPDSSRFWPAAGFAPGGPQPSFDKQYLRDWLEGLPWDKQPPPPALPPEIIERTAQKYREAYLLITGEPLRV